MSTHSHIDYYAYIMSPAWRAKANAAKQRAGYRCQVCNRHASEVQLDAHHRTYVRLGNEEPDDITVLCHSCHQLYETAGKLQQPPSSRRPMLQPQESTGAGLGTLPGESEVLPTEEVVDAAPTHKNAWLQLTSLVVMLGYLGNAAYFGWLELQMVLDDWLQVFNPFLHMMIFFNWITSAFMWQLVGVTIMGYVLSLLYLPIGSWLVPQYSTLRWYWHWGSTALVKVPLFLVVAANAVTMVPYIIGTSIVTYQHEWSIIEIPLLLPILSLFVALSPIPANHLIWDNQYPGGWRKLIISTLVVVMLVLLHWRLNYIWTDALCMVQKIPLGQCEPWHLYNLGES